MSKQSWDSEDSQKEEQVLAPDKNNLLVKIIEDDTTKLHKNLGITRADSERLQKVLHEQLATKKSLADIMVEISKHCQHANQLAFLCFALGRTTIPKGDRDSLGAAIKGAHVMRMSSDDPIGQILKDLFEEFKRKNKDQGD